VRHPCTAVFTDPTTTIRLITRSYLGIQLGVDFSTSHVENNFIGTGFEEAAAFAAQPVAKGIPKLLAVSAIMFVDVFVVVFHFDIRFLLPDREVT
jgi:hypothetical protein